MSTGSVQRRNDEMVSLLESDFCRWREFMADGARLLSAVLATHRQGGGNLRWGWMGDSCQNHGMGYQTAWTELNIGAGDYAATLNGGPYLDLDGATKALYINDAAWQEAGTRNLLVWNWCNPGGLAADITIASKYDINGNQRSWRLWLDNAGPNFVWTCNAVGAAANDFNLPSTYGVPIVDTWYFVAGHIQPNAVMHIYVGAAADTALTIDFAGGIPASLFDGSAPLGLGTAFNVAPALFQPWNGLLGVGHGRVDVPLARIDGHVSRLFHMTRQFYLA